jgi:hypothetical protein
MSRRPHPQITFTHKLSNLISSYAHKAEQITVEFMYFPLLLLKHMNIILNTAFLLLYWFTSYCKLTATKWAQSQTEGIDIVSICEIIQFMLKYSLRLPLTYLFLKTVHKTKYFIMLASHKTLNWNFTNHVLLI